MRKRRISCTITLKAKVLAAGIFTSLGIIHVAAYGAQACFSSIRVNDTGVSSATDDYALHIAQQIFIIQLNPRCMASGNALVLLPVLWVVVAVGWAPMLLSESLRDLCSRWPTGRAVVNYPVFVTIVVVTHVLTFLAVGIQFPSGSPLLPAWAFGSTLLVVVVGWLFVAVVLPASRDTSLPSNGRLLLAAGAVWYGVLVSIVFAVLAFLLFVLFFPG